MTPTNLLQSKLEEYKRSLFKSRIRYLDDDIDAGLYLIHRKNLKPKIKEYELAIKKLEGI